MILKRWKYEKKGVKDGQTDIAEVCDDVPVKSTNEIERFEVKPKPYPIYYPNYIIPAFLDISFAGHQLSLHIFKAQLGSWFQKSCCTPSQLHQNHLHFWESSSLH